MNYFAHGFRFVDRPNFLAGTAVPDWLSILNRRARAHEKLAEPFVNDPDPVIAEVAQGICQHHSDDAWFHSSTVFQIMQAEWTLRLRKHLPADRGFRASLVAHIMLEMLIDSKLIERTGDLIETYYAALLSLNGQKIQQAVNQMTTRETVGLPLLIPDFCGERFLMDYRQDATLLERLNNVMRRVRLNSLPETIIDEIAAARQEVEKRLDELLAQINLNETT